MKKFYTVISFCISTLFFVSAEENSDKSDKEKSEKSGSFYESLVKLEIPEAFQLPEIIIGDEKAPVTLIVYSSFTCNHCCEFHTEIFPKFKKKYADTGKVKIYLRNYLDDVGALEASILVRCLCKKNPEAVLKAYHELFGNQKEWLHSKDPRKFLKEIFVKIGYKESDIENSLKNKEIPAGLMKEQQQAMQQLHIFSVPAFINESGKMHIGKITLEELEELIKPIDNNARNTVNN